jgi:hypothetical protein
MTEYNRLVETLSNERDEKIVAQDKLWASIRAQGAKYNEAENKKLIILESKNQLTGRQVSYMDTSNELMNMSNGLGAARSRIDYTQSTNELLSNVLVVSDLQNHGQQTPTSLNKELKYNVSIWKGDGNHRSLGQRPVRMEKSSDEVCDYDREVSVLAYRDYPNQTDIGKALGFDKKTFGDLDSEDISLLQKKMRDSRGNMSRYTRLVIACAYYHALCKRGGDVVMDIDVRPEDLILPYNPANVCTVAKFHDAAIITCNQPAESSYLGFLYIIAREFPFARDILVNNVGEVCKAGELHVPEEGKRVVIMCDQKPSFIINNPIHATFTPSVWYCYLVNYAKSVYLEKYLDLAMCSAAMMNFHEHLGNITLPHRRSAGELFVRSCVTESLSYKVPSKYESDDMLSGAYCLSCVNAVVTKDLIGHDKSTKGGGTGARTIMAEIIRDRSTRRCWYNMLNIECDTSGIQVLKKLDTLNIDFDSLYVTNIMNLNTLGLWNMTNYDNSKTLAQTFSQCWVNTEFETRSKMRDKLPANVSRTIVLMRDLEMVKGDNINPRPIVPTPSYDRANISSAERMLQNGRVTVVRNGCRTNLKNSNNRRIYRNVRVAKPDEFIPIQPEPTILGDPDDTGESITDDMRLSLKNTIEQQDIKIRHLESMLANDDEIESRRQALIDIQADKDKLQSEIGSIIAMIRNTTVEVDKEEAEEEFPFDDEDVEEDSSKKEKEEEKEDEGGKKIDPSEGKTEEVKKKEGEENPDVKVDEGEEVELKPTNEEIKNKAIREYILGTWLTSVDINSDESVRKKIISSLTSSWYEETKDLEGKIEYVNILVKYFDTFDSEYILLLSSDVASARAYDVAVTSRKNRINKEVFYAKYTGPTVVNRQMGSTSEIMKAFRDTVFASVKEEMSQFGSYCTEDQEWYDRLWVKYGLHDHVHHGNTFNKDDTIFRYDNKAPQELCGCCGWVMYDALFTCVKNDGIIGKRIASRIGITQGVVKTFCSDRYGQGMIRRTKNWIGLGIVKNHPRNKVMEHALKFLYALGIIKEFRNSRGLQDWDAIMAEPNLETKKREVEKIYRWTHKLRNRSADDMELASVLHIKLMKTYK